MLVLFLSLTLNDQDIVFDGYIDILWVNSRHRGFDDDVIPLLNYVQGNSPVFYIPFLASSTAEVAPQAVHILLHLSKLAEGFPTSQHHTLLPPKIVLSSGKRPTNPTLDKNIIAWFIYVNKS